MRFEIAIHKTHQHLHLRIGDATKYWRFLWIERNLRNIKLETPWFTWVYIPRNNYITFSQIYWKIV